MRALMVLAAALMALASPAMAARQCAADADQSAFEVLSLRQLMTVLVIKCGRENDYNVNFIKRFQPVLQDNDRQVLSYFRRVYGNAAQGRKDTFTTELVNVMSQSANQQGYEFCSRTGLIVNELVALTAMADLAPYAAAKDLAPAGASMCPPPAGTKARK